ncbi:MAG: DUF177 domain-containing protein [Actinobacteria bacterium]|nr:MAG: DUF177 domain-containing protein [Actinomycetota bacterium]
MSDYLIDVSEILKSEGLSKNLKDEVELEPLEFREEVLQLKHVTLSLNLTNVGLGILVKGNLTGILLAQCNRCLAEFEHEINIKLDELFKKNLKEQEEDLAVTDNKINLGPIIDQSIILGIPIKLLCRDDCKGLCARCGKNLNRETCQCKQAPIDVRWDKLKEYFKKG